MDYNLTGILRHASAIDLPLDQFTEVFSIHSPRYRIPNLTGWMVADFQMGYDPCTCISRGERVDRTAWEVWEVWDVREVEEVRGSKLERAGRRQGDGRGLTMSPDGRVGINTEDFFDDHNLYVDGSVYIKDDGEEDHSLYIEGSTIAEEMFVELKTAWPDYVFQREYPLRPLADLEEFIRDNGRLPEMPRATEVEKEGIATGETIRLLTQKIEELMLYFLQQRQEIEAQRKTNRKFTLL